MASQFLIVIPARRQSTRLPEKLLLAETGRALLAHTVEAAQRAANDEQAAVWVACDDEGLADAARGAGAHVVMVTEACESGTERIWRALPRLPPVEVVVNLQADEPEMPIDWIRRCADAVASSAEIAVATMAAPLAAGDPAIEDPNVVKVVTDHESRAMYFSRCAIPAVRSGGKTPSPRALRHVGLYAFRNEFLRNYGALPMSSLEDAECLEQLRFLQAGAKIRVLMSDSGQAEFRGIDTADDYQAFVARRRSRH